MTTAHRIEGELLSSPELRTGGGEPYELRIIRLTPGADAAAELRRQSDSWIAVAREYGELLQSGRLPEDVAFRAHFASDVLFFAATQAATPSPETVTMLAMHGDNVVGVTIFHFEDDEAEISWVTVDPRFLAGAPTPAADQVRGIGTSMVCAAADAILSGGATTIALSALDDAADRFWRARGFEPCRGDSLCVEGRAGVEAMAMACSTEPDDPANSDEVCICGTWESLRDFRLPGLRELMPQ